MSYSGDEKKLLSIIVPGRNDDYYGNFKYRITTCLNYLAKSIKKSGRLEDVEILITDWNSSVPLNRVLLLSREASEICRFIRVPPSVAVLKHHDQRQTFNIACAMNVGLRRARGYFSIAMPADVLFPEYSFRTLFDLLDKKISIPFDLNACLFLFSGGFFKWDVCSAEPALDELDRCLMMCGEEAQRNKDWPGLGLGSVGYMTASAIWHDCHGYDEDLSLWGWNDAEAMLRMSQRYPWFDLANIGVRGFILEHDDPFNSSAAKNFTSYAGNYNPARIHASFEVNDKNWGFGNLPLEIESSSPAADREHKEHSGSLLEAGAKSHRDILTEMHNQRHRGYLRSVFTRWSIPNNAEWFMSCVAAWHTFYSHPKFYLDIGITQDLVALVALGASPTMECYAIEPWNSEGGTTIPHPMSFTRTLHMNGFRGYLRFITGDPSTAFNRLQSSLSTPIIFDLVVFRGQLFKGKEEILRQLEDIFKHLSTKGMVLFHCQSKEVFKETWKSLQTQYPKMVFWGFEKFNFGVVLAEFLGRSFHRELSAKDRERFFQVWRRQRPSFLSRSVRLIKRALVKLFRLSLIHADE